MNHVITIRDVVWTAGIAATFFTIVGVGLWYLRAINSDI